MDNNTQIDYYTEKREQWLTGEDDNTCELPELMPTFGNTLYENDGEDAGPAPLFEVEVGVPTSGPVAALGVDGPDAGAEDWDIEVCISCGNQAGDAINWSANEKSLPIWSCPLCHNSASWEIFPA